MSKRSLQSCLIYRLGRYAGRMALVAGMGWFVTTQTWSWIGDLRPNVEPVATSTNPAVALNELVSDMPPLGMEEFLHGDWQFAGIAWQMGVLQGSISPDALSGQLRENRTKTDFDQQVLGLLRMLGASRLKKGNLTQLEATFMGYRVTALVSNEPQVGELLERAEVRFGKHMQSGFSLKPSRSIHATVADTADDVPSLDSVGEVLATRWTANGQCVGLLFESRLTFDELSDHWRRQSWQIEPSVGVENGQLHICQRRGHTWSATSFPSVTGGRLMLLTRIPQTP